MTIPIAASVFRDYVTDGVPASGPNPPNKREIRSWGAWLESLLSGGGPGLGYATLALLNADLAHAANSLAIVYSDTTAANNGLYQKVGASGSGSWTRAGDLPASIIPLTVTGGTADAIVATAPQTPLQPGSKLYMLVPTATNTGAAMTIAVNGASAVAIKNALASTPAANTFVNGVGTLLFWSVDHYQALVSIAVDTAGVVADATAARDAAAASAAAAAASEAALGNEVHQYDNRAQAQSATVPTGVNIIRTLSYASFGDGGAQSLKAVLSDPGDAGKLQSANGRWFQAIEDGLIVDPRRYGVKCRGAIDGIDDTAAWREAFSKVPPYGAIFVPPSLQGSLIRRTGTETEIFLCDKPINILGVNHGSCFITDPSIPDSVPIFKATTTQDIDWRQALWSSFKIANYQSTFFGNPVDYVPGAPILPTRSGGQAIWFNGGTTNGGFTRVKLQNLFIGQNPNSWSIAIDGGVTVGGVYTPVTNRMHIDGCEVFGGLLLNAIADDMKITNSTFMGVRGVDVNFSSAGLFTFTQNTLIAPANIIIRGGTTSRIIGNYMEEIANTAALRLDDAGARAFVDISGASGTVGSAIVAENLINVFFSTAANCIRDDNASNTIVRDNRMTVGGSQYHWRHNGSSGFRYPNVYSTANAVTGTGTWNAESPR